MPLRGLGPKGVRVALAAGIARQLHETVRGSAFLRSKNIEYGTHVVLHGLYLFVPPFSLCLVFPAEITSSSPLFIFLCNALLQCALWEAEVMLEFEGVSSIDVGAGHISDTIQRQI